MEEEGVVSEFLLQLRGVVRHDVRWSWDVVDYVAVPVGPLVFAGHVFVLFPTMTIALPSMDVGLIGSPGYSVSEWQMWIASS